MLSLSVLVPHGLPDHLPDRTASPQAAELLSRAIGPYAPQLPPANLWGPRGNGELDRGPRSDSRRTLAATGIRPQSRVDRDDVCGRSPVRRACRDLDNEIFVPSVSYSVVVFLQRCWPLLDGGSDPASAPKRIRLRRGPLDTILFAVASASSAPSFVNRRRRIPASRRQRLRGGRVNPHCIDDSGSSQLGFVVRTDRCRFDTSAALDELRVAAWWSHPLPTETLAASSRRSNAASILGSSHDAAIRPLAFLAPTSRTDNARLAALDSCFQFERRGEDGTSWIALADVLDHHVLSGD